MGTGESDTLVWGQAKKDLLDMVFDSIPFHLSPGNHKALFA